jgi:hypothetical protein
MHNLIPDSNPALFVKLLCCGQLLCELHLLQYKRIIYYYEELRARGYCWWWHPVAIAILACQFLSASSSRIQCSGELLHPPSWMMKIGREEQKQPPHGDKFIMDGHAHFTEASSEGRNGRRRQKWAIGDADASPFVLLYVGACKARSKKRGWGNNKVQFSHGSSSFQLPLPSFISSFADPKCSSKTSSRHPVSKSSQILFGME